MVIHMQMKIMKPLVRLHYLIRRTGLAGGVNCLLITSGFRWPNLLFTACRHRHKAKIEAMRHHLKSIDSLAAVLFAALALTGCDNIEKSKEVSLAMLTENAAHFDNNQVITRGIVRRFEEPLHYWIEDEDLNRVELFPQEQAALHLGEAVSVQGYFRFSATEGRRLTLTRIKRE